MLEAVVSSERSVKQQNLHETICCCVFPLYLISFAGLGPVYDETFAVPDNPTHFIKYANSYFDCYHIKWSYGRLHDYLTALTLLRIEFHLAILVIEFALENVFVF